MRDRSEFDKPTVMALLGAAGLMIGAVSAAMQIAGAFVESNKAALFIALITVGSAPLLAVGYAKAHRHGLFARVGVRTLLFVVTCTAVGLILGSAAALLTQHAAAEAPPARIGAAEVTGGVAREARAIPEHTGTDPHVPAAAGDRSTQ
ncbi:hypothetical protein [Micromonospora aurantiaca (nom. illeg.)]|uniref:hypothetical protein n=1 Tax=Micromonospora aurantiaca (nom. illeg.) TaxID=47850 RepID=UPI003647AD4F